MGLYKELKRRNVFRVSVVYLVVAWLLLQIGDTLVPALRLPEWAVSLLAFFLILGFPVAIQPFFLVAAWLIGPRGDLQGTALWIVTVFIGIMAHELGHAFAGRHYHLDPVITLP